MSLQTRHSPPSIGLLEYLSHQITLLYIQDVRYPLPFQIRIQQARLNGKRDPKCHLVYGYLSVTDAVLSLYVLSYKPLVHFYDFG